MPEGQQLKAAENRKRTINGREASLFPLYYRQATWPSMSAALTPLIPALDPEVITNFRFSCLQPLDPKPCLHEA